MDSSKFVLEHAKLDLITQILNNAIRWFFWGLIGLAVFFGKDTGTIIGLFILLLLSGWASENKDKKTEAKK